MTVEEQLAQLKNEFEEFKNLYNKDNFSALKVIRKQQQFVDGVNVEVGSSDGTKIGTAITQKLGFYNATPVDKPETVADADGSLGGATTAINTLIDRIQELGLIK